jgi:phosphatidylserine decarboxylase
MHPLALGAAGLVGGWLYFHRQPARQVPPDPRSIVSPADGRVIHIERCTTPELAFFKRDVLNVLTPLGIKPPYKVVVIELTLTDVHVQRAPVAGHVLAQQYYPGLHENAVFGADTVHLANTNEKLLTVIGGGVATVGVVQVAGVLARRIVPYVAPGAVLAKGDRLGMITFGSQVVLLLPDQAALHVGVGSRVVDGASIVATMPAPQPQTLLPALSGFCNLHTYD